MPACPDGSRCLPAVPFCEVQPSEFAPAASVAARSAGTKYYLNLALDGSQMPGSSQIFNNHIPLDPQLAGRIAITKTTPLVNVTRGQLVPYAITVNNRQAHLLTDVSIVDRLPAGFSYVQGSALLDGVPTEPSVDRPRTRVERPHFAQLQARTVKLLLAVGAGVSEGEFVNRAQVIERS